MACGAPAPAQNYPVKPIRFVVGFPPSGANDILARAVAPKLTEYLGQQLVIENRGGASTMIATEMVARAAPDGYTILLNAPAHSTNPTLAKPQYDSVRDFAFISLVAESQKSGSRRTPAAPGIPTLAESGLPGFDVTSWFGIAAPAKTPRAIIDQINSAIVRAVNTPDLRARLQDQGAEPVGNTPEQYTAFIQNEITKWAKVIQAAGIKGS